MMYQAHHAFRPCSPDSQSSDEEYPCPPDEEPEADLRSEDAFFNEHNVPGRNYGAGMETEETPEVGVEETVPSHSPLVLCACLTI